MSREGDDRDAGEVAEEAAGWFVRLRDEDAPHEAWLAFERWLGASPAHAAAYERLEALWVELDQVPPGLIKAPGAAANDSTPTAQGRADRGLPRRAWLAAGAGLAATVALAVFGAASWVQDPAYVAYDTAPGQTRDITLADGSHLRLNADSHIQVSLGRRARRVRMTDAEATFDVTHDPRRPFLIAVGDRAVKVVGTQFNLRRRDGRIDLTVRRGVVEVRPAGDEGSTPARVRVGQRLTHREGSVASQVAPADPEEAFAWTRGQLIYRDAPLSEVAADLSRSLGASVNTADRAAATLRFTGVLTIDDTASVVRRLEAFAPIRAEKTAAGVVLHRRAGG